MAEPSTCVIDMPFAELPVTGAVKMPQHKGFCRWEKLLSEAIGSFTAGEPTAYNLKGTLRWPEAMQQPAQVLVADPLAPQNGFC